MVVWLIAFSYPDYFCPEYLHWSLGLIMAAMYIANMSPCKDFTTSLGTVKEERSADLCTSLFILASESMGTTLPTVDGIRFADDRKRQSGQQTVGDLAANMWIFLYDATAASLPNLGITRTHPFPVYSPTHPHRDDPSK
ncbi:hypothetical protein GQ55_9G248900 [Panicum hallii var. hallii]|jgi:hypothetical protein|uniref:Uncharacterized protein n=1 Tax=Panicum hallii var. hallii TaxID=1504633 RepID=A0A2T7C6Q3_9POAL|nr:hypothetical protein GQ55_9G248900 [Panicum hallii var. hallii]